jgi:hypothetical protein
MMGALAVAKTPMSAASSHAHASQCRVYIERVNGAPGTGLERLSSSNYLRCKCMLYAAVQGTHVCPFTRHCGSHCRRHACSFNIFAYARVTAPRVHRTVNGAPDTGLERVSSSTCLLGTYVLHCCACHMSALLPSLTRCCRPATSDPIAGATPAPSTLRPLVGSLQYYLRNLTVLFGTMSCEWTRSPQIADEAYTSRLVWCMRLRTRTWLLEDILQRGTMRRPSRSPGGRSRLAAAHASSNSCYSMPCMGSPSVAWRTGSANFRLRCFFRIWTWSLSTTTNWAFQKGYRVPLCEA